MYVPSCPAWHHPAVDSVNTRHLTQQSKEASTAFSRCTANVTISLNSGRTSIQLGNVGWTIPDSVLCCPSLVTPAHSSQNFVDLSQPRTQRFWESHKPLTKGLQEQGDVWSEKQPNPRGSNVLAVGRDECRGIRGRTKVILAILVHQVVRGTIETKTKKKKKKKKKKKSSSTPLLARNQNQERFWEA